MLLDQLAQVDQGVAHPAQSGVDADPGIFGDLLEAHILVHPHLQYELLVFGQLPDQFADIGFDLVLDQLLLGIEGTLLHHGEDIEFRATLIARHAVVLPEVVYDQVMGDAHYPGVELPFFIVLALLQGADDLDKGILEDILGYFAVEDFGVDKGGKALVVPVDQGFQGAFVSLDISFYKRGIVCLQIHTTYFFEVRLPAGPGAR